MWQMPPSKTDKVIREGFNATFRAALEKQLTAERVPPEDSVSGSGGDGSLSVFEFGFFLVNQQTLEYYLPPEATRVSCARCRDTKKMTLCCGRSTRRDSERRLRAARGKKKCSSDAQPQVVYPANQNWALEAEIDMDTRAVCEDIYCLGIWGLLLRCTHVSGHLRCLIEA